MRRFNEWLAGWRRGRTKSGVPFVVTLEGRVRVKASDWLRHAPNTTTGQE